jgi:hypothetical protein
MSEKLLRKYKKACRPNLENLGGACLIQQFFNMLVTHGVVDQFNPTNQI